MNSGGAGYWARHRDTRNGPMGQLDNSYILFIHRHRVQGPPYGRGHHLPGKTCNADCCGPLHVTSTRGTIPFPSGPTQHRKKEKGIVRERNETTTYDCDISPFHVMKTQPVSEQTQTVLLFLLCHTHCQMLFFL